MGGAGYRRDHWRRAGQKTGRHYLPWILYIKDCDLLDKEWGKGRMWILMAIVLMVMVMVMIVVHNTQIPSISFISNTTKLGVELHVVILELIVNPSWTSIL